MKNFKWLLLPLFASLASVSSWASTNPDTPTPNEAPEPKCIVMQVLDKESKPFVSIVKSRVHSPILARPYLLFEAREAFLDETGQQSSSADTSQPKPERAQLLDHIEMLGYEAELKTKDNGIIKFLILELVMIRCFDLTPHWNDLANEMGTSWDPALRAAGDELIEVCQELNQLNIDPGRTFSQLINEVQSSLSSNPDLPWMMISEQLNVLHQAIHEGLDLLSKEWPEDLRTKANKVFTRMLEVHYPAVELNPDYSVPLQPAPSPIFERSVSPNMED